ncbi:MAG: YbaN family protein [Candidatus Kapabacteria bacterium]|nr:YbaN family protein [Candidatus Kapabacteria bacterium]
MNKILNRISKRAKKWIYIITANFLVLLGVIGIFVPVLPTTIFLILAASLYMRSSEYYYNWLMNNKILGKYIKDYVEHKGMPISSKIVSITFLWVGISFSVIFLIETYWVKLLLLAIAVGVTTHLIMLKTLKKEVSPQKNISLITNTAESEII